MRKLLLPSVILSILCVCIPLDSNGKHRENSKSSLFECDFFQGYFAAKSETSFEKITLPYTESTYIVGEGFEIISFETTPLGNSNETQTDKPRGPPILL